MNSSLLGEHREHSLELVRQHSAGNIRVFGSLSRGTAGAGSDLSGLKLALEDLVCGPVDLVSGRRLSPYLKQQILAEAIPL